MSDRPKQLHALQLLFLLIPDSHYQLLKDTLLLLHATAEQVQIISLCFHIYCRYPSTGPQNG